MLVLVGTLITTANIMNVRFHLRIVAYPLILDRQPFTTAILFHRLFWRQYCNTRTLPFHFLNFLFIRLFIRQYLGLQFLPFMFSGHKIPYTLKTMKTIIGKDIKYVEANIIPLSHSLCVVVQPET